MKKRMVLITLSLFLGCEATVKERVQAGDCQLGTNLDIEYELPQDELVDSCRFEYVDESSHLVLAGNVTITHIIQIGPADFFTDEWREPGDGIITIVGIVDGIAISDKHSLQKNLGISRPFNWDKVYKKLEPTFEDGDDATVALLTIPGEGLVYGKGKFKYESMSTEDDGDRPDNPLIELKFDSVKFTYTTEDDEEQIITLDGKLKVKKK